VGYQLLSYMASSQVGESVVDDQIAWSCVMIVLVCGILMDRL